MLVITMLLLAPLLPAAAVAAGRAALPARANNDLMTPAQRQWLVAAGRADPAASWQAPLPSAAADSAASEGRDAGGATAARGAASVAPPPPPAPAAPSFPPMSAGQGAALLEAASRASANYYAYHQAWGQHVNQAVLCKPSGAGFL